jgi:hypothetical protein
MPNISNTVGKSTWEAVEFPQSPKSPKSPTPIDESSGHIPGYAGHIPYRYSPPGKSTCRYDVNASLQ